MEKIEHTPGPWSAVVKEKVFDQWDGIAISSNNDANDAELTHEKNGGIRIGRAYGPDALANAHLIAAAPDMLEVLQALVANILEYERGANLAPNPGRKYCWDSVERAVHVIAKAKGEPV